MALLGSTSDLVAEGVAPVMSCKPNPVASALRPPNLAELPRAARVLTSSPFDQSSSVWLAFVGEIRSFSACLTEASPPCAEPVEAPSFVAATELRGMRGWSDRQ